MLKFEGKHILITGGPRGLGFEIAKGFVESGAVVSIFDIHEQNLEEAQKYLSGKKGSINTQKIHVADQEEVKAGVRKAEDIAPIDVLINNAGIA